MKTFTERMSARIARNSKPRERNIRDDLDERVRSYGGHTRAAAWLGRLGCPDVLCIFPPSPLRRDSVPRLGATVWVETKMGRDGRLTKHQKEEIALLRSAGEEVYVITTLAELDAWLPELPF